LLLEVFETLMGMEIKKTVMETSNVHSDSRCTKTYNFNFLGFNNLNRNIICKKAIWRKILKVISINIRNKPEHGNRADL
jgi:hypothetical protein